MAKKEKEASPDGEEKKEGDAAAEGDAPKQSFIKKLLGNKLILFGGVGVILLLAIGGGAYFFLFAGEEEHPAGEAAEHELPVTPPHIAFYDMPDIIVNIQGQDSNPAYLKLSVSLELENEEEKAGIQALQPRIVDQFQAYLREMRMDDLKGSAGVVRLKEELLRRINASAAPYRVRDVLLKQMIVQ